MQQNLVKFSLQKSKRKAKLEKHGGLKLKKSLSRKQRKDRIASKRQFLD